MDNNIPSAVVNTYSIRAGGATALFSAGADWVTIHRSGRWKSFAFHEYAWRDFTGFLDLCAKIAPAKGLGKFLADVDPYRKKARFEATPPFSDSRVPTSTRQARRTPFLHRRFIRDVFEAAPIYTLRQELVFLFTIFSLIRRFGTSAMRIGRFLYF